MEEENLIADIENKGWKEIYSKLCLCFLKTLYLSLYTLLYSRWRYAVITSIKDKKKKMLSCSFCRKRLASALFFATIAVV